jgi:hypothetical protein
MERLSAMPPFDVHPIFREDAAKALLRELTDALSADPVNPTLVTEHVKRSQAFLDAEEA